MRDDPIVSEIREVRRNMRGGFTTTCTRSARISGGRKGSRGASSFPRPLPLPRRTLSLTLPLMRHSHRG